MRYLLLLMLLCSLLATTAAAQQASYLPFFSPDTVQVQQVAVAHRAAAQRYFVVPKTGSSEYRDHYRKIAREAVAEVYNSVRYSALLDPVLNPYVQRVFQQITQANPQLPAAQLVLSRSPEPNAHAVGNSTVMLNLGLLARLENESQLAYVLCHELAHMQAQHMETSLRERLTTLHSKELKEEVRRITAEEYNISSKLKALALGMSLNSTYHQRKHEKQADSLGYVLLKRTDFDATQSYRVLQLLDKIDQPLATAPLDLAGYFGCTTFPYPLPTAPAKPKSIFTVAAPVQTALEMTDTLKSHPDCAKRMRYLRELAQGQVADGPPATPSNLEFARIAALSRLEVVQSWFDYDCYDHALFEALQLLPEQPQSVYLRSVVTLSLYQLHKHLLNHTFTEVVGNVSRHHPESFNQLLTTLYAWKAEDYPHLSACFAQANAPGTVPATDEYTLAAQYAAATLAAAPTAASFQQQYLAHYQHGKFLPLLFPKAPSKKSLR
jgi:Zn-dependent protease with chaperone function